MSAGTFSELLILAAGRGFTEDALALSDQMEPEIVSVDEAAALAVGDAFAARGKGRHPAKLNFGDCFAHALAKHRDLPFLYVGEDFARTDARSALGPG